LDGATLTARARADAAAAAAAITAAARAACTPVATTATLTPVPSAPPAPKPVSSLTAPPSVLCEPHVQDLAATPAIMRTDVSAAALSGAGRVIVIDGLNVARAASFIGAPVAGAEGTPIGHAQALRAAIDYHLARGFEGATTTPSYCSSRAAATRTS